jgi:hypothetical protein
MNIAHICEWRISKPEDTAIHENDHVFRYQGRKSGATQRIKQAGNAEQE